LGREREGERRRKEGESERERRCFFEYDDRQTSRGVLDGRSWLCAHAEEEERRRALAVCPKTGAPDEGRRLRERERGRTFRLSCLLFSVSFFFFLFFSLFRSFEWLETRMVC
jgi:hypothetical protein